MKKLNKTVTNLYLKVKNALANKKGEAYIDTGVKIIIAVVIGTLLLSLLYALFKTVIAPELQTQVEGLFSYTN